MIPGRAYVLGNGPTLPVRELYKLHGALTVGVNRILRSGFEPTVVMFPDAAVWDSDGKQLRKSAALVVGPDDCDAPIVRVPVRRFPWGELPQSIGLREMCAAPDSVAAAVLWLLALGVDDVQVLGCGGGSDGRTHFYGDHIDANTAALYKSGIGSAINTLFTWAPLQSVFGGAVHFSDDLRKPVHDVKNKDALRAHLHGVIE